jgi:uncharacterized protein YqjF (DUF2071 family)
MFSFLKNHPFAVEAFFKSSLVLTFAVPKEELQDLIPKCLTLDTFQDNWGFIAIAAVKTTQLRPKGFPKILGNDFLLIGYRIFVRYHNSDGKSLRGLYILKSETDKKKMEWLGKIFTNYNYSTTDIIQSSDDKKISITSKISDFNIEVKQIEEGSPLPPDSPFANWKEARQYAGPLPHTFTFDSQKNEVLIIEGIRHNWKPSPLAVINYQIPFLQTLHLKNVRLANAFIITNVPYYWKKGKIEKWKG